jgi:hypothetical protein
MFYPPQNSTPFENPLVLGAFAKFRKVTISFVMVVRLSVCPNGNIGAPLSGFSLNLIFDYFSKISSLIKI